MLQLQLRAQHFWILKILYLFYVIGAHTLGRFNTHDGGTWDETPDYFDNNYYKQLLDISNSWRIGNRTSV